MGRAGFDVAGTERKGAVGQGWRGVAWSGLAAQVGLGVERSGKAGVVGRVTEGIDEERQAW